MDLLKVLQSLGLSGRSVPKWAEYQPSWENNPYYCAVLTTQPDLTGQGLPFEDFLATDDAGGQSHLGQIGGLVEDSLNPVSSPKASLGGSTFALASGLAYPGAGTGEFRSDNPANPKGTTVTLGEMIAYLDATGKLSPELKAKADALPLYILSYNGKLCVIPQGKTGLFAFPYDPAKPVPVKTPGPVFVPPSTPLPPLAKNPVSPFNPYTEREPDPPAAPIGMAEILAALQAMPAVTLQVMLLMIQALLSPAKK